MLLPRHSRSSWLQTLSNQLSDCSPYIRYADHTCYWLYYFSLNYRRLGFNCESILNANYDFSLREQILEHNFYYAMIDSVHVIPVLTLLHSCDQRWASCATWSLLPVTTFQILSKQDCRPASSRRWTSQWREQLPVLPCTRQWRKHSATIQEGWIT